MENDWFILRCAGRSTLVLAKTLAQDGFEVWTPARTQTIRVPRMNVRREIKLPLLPSFVFARARHLVDLIELANMAEKPRRDPNGGRSSRPAHKDFSVFHYHDTIPIIADHELEPLRISEAQAVPKKKSATFGKDAKVRVKSGPFEGARGKVEECKSGHALVLFTDWKRPVKIPTWLLSEVNALSQSSASVAKAA